MAGPSSKLPAARKRTRKRKRRVASSSSSSSSSGSDSDSSASDVQRTVTIPVNVKAQKIPIEPSEASSSSSSSSSEDSSDESDSEVEPQNAPKPDTPGTKIPQENTKQPKAHRPPSPPPKPVPIPSFLASSDDPEKDKRDEEQLRERFRKFWMATIVDAFSDDLEEIRKVGFPALSPKFSASHTWLP
ncbi:hypothetical protein NLI96_g3574 [Meripilus lineatus]|uniref:Ribosome assembly protein 3 n=1 Tax=Meripilus lineatus TaxID=2056292 RepID=A0AAD5V813_9APHY|nr:hypothetical protein NLI96_g3574 [Physisporinus lineatus]